MANGNQASTGRGTAFVLVCVTLVALVLQIAGLASNGWVVIHYSPSSPRFSSRFELSMGLWMVEYCINDDCGTKGVKEYLNDIAGWSTGLTNEVDKKLDEYRGETITGAVAIFIALVCIVIQKSRNSTSGQNADSLVIWIVTCFSAGVSAVMASIASGKFDRDLSDTLRLVGHRGPYLVSYSTIITGVGAALAAVTFFVAAIKIYKVNKHRNINQQLQQQQQMAAMAYQHPQQQRFVMSTYPSAGNQYAMDYSNAHGYQSARIQESVKEPSYVSGLQHPGHFRMY